MKVPRVISLYRTKGGPEDQRQEDSQNGLPPSPVGGNAVRGSVRATYDSRRDFLPGEALCLGTVHGVQGGDGAYVAGSPSTDTAWEGNRSDMALVNHAPRQGAMYLQDVITNLWGTTEFPY